MRRLLEIDSNQAARSTGPADEMPTRLTRFADGLFYLKAKYFQSKRFIENLNSHIAHHKKASPEEFSFAWAESASPLWSEVRPSERFLQLGKIQNLRCALKHIHQTKIPADQIFSFWRQVGKVTKREGYTLGREIRGGCIVPSLGGGLCQLSNALYDAALKAGFEIVERHAHSKIIPGSVNTNQRDATIFWNYVDLRFRPQQDCLIEAFLTKDHLVVRFRGKRPQNSRLSAPPVAY